MTNAYVKIFKTKTLVELQYRVAALAGIFTQIFWGFMLILLYRAFYSTGIEVTEFSLSNLCTYIWLQQAFLSLLAFGILDGDIIQKIVKGDVCYELVRPINVYNNWFVTSLGGRIGKILIRCLPILILSAFLPAGMGLSLPSSFGTLALFLISLVAGTVLGIVVVMFTYVLVFKALTAKGVTQLIRAFAGFCGGFLVPIPLMPVWLQNILNFLPFRYSTDAVFRIYMGNISGIDAVVQIAIQIFWVVVLVVLGKFLISRVLRKVEVQGG